MIIASLLLLALAQEPGPFELLRSEISITSKILPSDCTVRRFGGKELHWCDVAPAFARALDECRDSADQVWAATRESRCFLVLHPGTYYVGSTIKVCGGNEIALRGARLFAGAGVTAFRFEGFAACQASGYSKPGLSSMTGLDLRTFAAAGEEVTRGVDASAAIHLRDFLINGDFTQGIRIDAGALRPGTLASNANGWALENGGILGARHAGLFVDGPDANVGRAMGITVVSSCGAGAALQPSLGPCADIVSHEFLGSTFVGASTGYAKDETTGENFPGFLLGEDANSRSVCVGCYAEAWAVAGPADSHAQKNTNVFGGLARWYEGPTIQGYAHKGLEVVSIEGNLALRAGALAGGGALTLAPIGLASAQPVRFKLDPANNALRVDVANLNAGVVLRIGLSALAIGGSGGLVLEPSNVPKNVWLNNSGTVLQGKAP